MSKPSASGSHVAQSLSQDDVLIDLTIGLAAALAGVAIVALAAPVTAAAAVGTAASVIIASFGLASATAKAALHITAEVSPTAKSALKSDHGNLELIDNLSDPVKLIAGASVEAAADKLQPGSGKKTKAAFDLAYSVAQMSSARAKLGAPRRLERNHAALEFVLGARQVQKDHVSLSAEMQTRQTSGGTNLRGGSPRQL